MRATVFAFVAVLVVLPIGNGLLMAQRQNACLHDAAARTSAGHEKRRQDALALARRINVAEAMAARTVRPGEPRYRPLAELGGIPRTPQGFRLLFVTNGEAYSFSLKDSLDPCRYTIVSDHERELYEARPSPESAGVMPIS